MAKSDKIRIPHEYLPALRRMREGSIIPSDLHKVDAFIAAAEADAPPLPEGLVLLELSSGAHIALWHKDGRLYYRDDYTSLFGGVEGRHDRLTPLHLAPASSVSV